MCLHATRLLWSLSFSLRAEISHDITGTSIPHVTGLTSCLLLAESHELATCPSFLRDIHNDFHAGLGSTFLDMIMGVPEVDAVA